MKNLFTLTFLILVYTGLAGQTLDNPGTPEERAQKITQQMIQALPLDSVQIDTIYALNLKYAQIAQLEIIEPEISMWSRYRKGQKLNKQKEEELLPLLSETQWENYLKQKSASKKQMLKKLFR